jgi:hypothetical protein
MVEYANYKIDRGNGLVEPRVSIPGFPHATEIDEGNEPKWLSQFTEELVRASDLDTAARTAIVETAALQWYERLLADASSYLDNRRRNTNAFERQLQQRWGNAFDRLELLLAFCQQVGADVFERTQGHPEKQAPPRFVALSGLHAVGCRTGSEILALLKSGHAAGAMARWRTLHEHAVVAQFIDEQGGDTAERFVAHRAIGKLKASEKHNLSANESGQPPIDEPELKGLERERDVLVTRYGKGFKTDYGWAAAALGNPDSRPNFSEIQTRVKQDRWSGSYQVANQRIHTVAAEILESDAVLGPVEIVTASPSNRYLGIPGNSAALALYRLTLILVHNEPTATDLLAAIVLGKLVTDVQMQFVDADNQLETEEEQLWR